MTTSAKIKEIAECKHCEKEIKLIGFKYCSNECSEAYQENKRFLLSLPIMDELKA